VDLDGFGVAHHCLAGIGMPRAQGVTKTTGVEDRQGG
jgi:hypothetical protein